MRVLYVTYDGLLDPLGQSQVIPYIEGLARRHGHQFDVISFEKPAAFADGDARSATEARLQKSAIEWHPLRYHKRPSPVATTYDVVAARRLAKRLVDRASFDLLHCRSYVASLVGRSIGRAHSIPYVFDMRGFWVDERVEGGLWKRNGLLFRVGKRCERAFLADAAAIVTLTRASVPIVEAWRDAMRSTATVDVIPTAVELNLFEPRSLPPVGAPPVLGYFGSLGPWYPLDAIMDLCRCCGTRAPEVRFRFLVNGDSDAVRSAAAARGLDGRVAVESVSHAGVSEAMRGVVASICLVNSTFSAQARCLTKFGESLALGCPVVVNSGSGDLAEIVSAHRIGVVLDDFSPEELEKGVDQLFELLMDPSVAIRCRDVAETEFALESAVDQYNAIYRRLAPDAP